jgi:hypothetical protein
MIAFFARVQAIPIETRMTYHASDPKVLDHVAEVPIERSVLSMSRVFEALLNEAKGLERSELL